MEAVKSINIIPCAHILKSIRQYHGHEESDQSPSPPVQNIIQSYIHGQRSREALNLSSDSSGASTDDLSLAESGRSTASPLLTPGTDSASISDPLRREDISLLTDIFDTPECRTEVSPSGTTFCHLRRRPATIYRSSKQQSKTGQQNGTIDQHQLAIESHISYCEDSSCLSLPYSSEPFTLEQLCESPTDYNPPPQARQSQATSGPAGRLNIIAQKMPPLSAIKKLIGLESLGAKLPLLQVPGPVTKSLCADPSTTSLKPSLSQRRRREPLTIEKCKTMPASLSTPGTAGSPTSMLTDADTVATTLSSPASSPARSRPQSLQYVSQASVAEKIQTSRRWSTARSALDSAVRNLTPPPSRSSFSAEYARSTSPARALVCKTEQLASKFRKLEVEEIIDIETLQSSFPDFEELSTQHKARSRRRSTSAEDRHRSSSASSALRSLVPTSRKRNKSTSPPRPPIVIPTEPRPGSSASACPSLPTIPESTRFFHPLLSPIISPISPTLTRQSSLHASHGIIHGPIRLTPTSPTATLESHLASIPPKTIAITPPDSSSEPSSPCLFDISGFQSAISGPTGDFYQTGFGLPPLSPTAAPDPDSVLAEDLEAWFDDWGFQSEGRWVERSEVRPIVLNGGGEMSRYVWAQGDDETWAWRLRSEAEASAATAERGRKAVPRPRPRMSMASTRSSGGMSANLTDVTDFLGWEGGF
ncbi:MAG: hypothetical protein M1814_002583 [Vezdaea aestivalis]|nr:MAG: hypothetical protein M1814_002583 [Vezdaea aestivalis]